ncbi:hypothetical protein FZEAL_8810 [Fusarium zealandicum]|uniref:Aminoglycoside phosphotransferase domain-containing protein n=1 Tax=Fusarium zealandicum TaxID=1053134 RepID=A0A8H4UE26_9HYPO|nr:hypothetical protein FZEAL_8810 [Fusarium zealandicum]
MTETHYHIPIRFQDGVRWIARIYRLNVCSPPKPIRQHYMRSESATLVFLEETSLPTPKVHYWTTETNSPFGVGLILVDDMPGKPIEWRAATEDQKLYVMDQLADIFIELAGYPCNCIGAFYDPGTSLINQCADPLVIDVSEEVIGVYGPFYSARAYHTTALQLILDGIDYGEMYETRAEQAYLITLFLQDLAHYHMPFSRHDDEEFFIQFPYSRAEHILVDDNFKITGIVNWDMVQAVAPGSAFRAPQIMLDFQDLFRGDGEPSDAEEAFAHRLELKLRPDIAYHVRRGRLLYQLDVCIHLLPHDPVLFDLVFQGLRDTIGEHAGAGLDMDEWDEMARARCADNTRLELMRRRDQDHRRFGH